MHGKMISAVQGFERNFVYKLITSQKLLCKINKIYSLHLKWLKSCSNPYDKIED